MFDEDVTQLDPETKRFAELLALLEARESARLLQDFIRKFFPQEAQRRRKRPTPRMDHAIALQFMGRTMSPARVLTKLVAAKPCALMCRNLGSPVASIALQRLGQRRSVARWLENPWPGSGYTIFFDSTLSWCVTQHHDDFWIHVKPASSPRESSRASSR